MERAAVESTTMRSVGYDPAERILEIEFATGMIYRYLEVPAGVFDELMQAASKGRYFNHEIRENYLALRVLPAPPRSRTRRAPG